MNIINKFLEKGATTQIPKRIIIHAMSEYLEYKGKQLHAYNFLKEIGLSAHALICPNGDIIRCRKDNQGAYHAKGYNKNSLGVEFLVSGTHTYESFLDTISNFYLTFEQHISGVELVREWISKYDIENINKHNEVDDRKIKQDPGEGFPWSQFIKDINNK